MVEKEKTIKRRELLTLGSAGLVSFAGCLDFGDTEISLGGARVENMSDIEREAEVHIKKDGEIVNESVVSVHPFDVGPGSEIIECTWPDQDEGVFVISARLTKQEEWVELSSNEADDSSCWWASIELTPHDNVSPIWRDCERNNETLCEMQEP